MHIPARLLVLATAVLPSAFAQTCEVAVDVNTEARPLSSWPGGIEGDTPVEAGGSFYFRAWTLATGMELWRTNGTAAGTVLVSDILPGPDSSDPRDLIEHAGLLYFTAEDPVAGRELWRSDGTPSGTVRVKDIGPGAADGQVGELTSLGARLYFVADDGVTGLEIWSTDGTTAGTALTLDAFPGPGSLDPFELTAGPSNAKLFFSGNISGAGVELAALDTQTNTAAMVKDINPGYPSSTPTGLRVFGGKLYFQAFEPSIGAELFVSDGTEAGTQLVKDIFTGPFDSSPDLSMAVELAGELYFAADSLGAGVELWKTDGTAAGTLLAAEVSPGYTSGNPTGMVAMGGEIYFSGFEDQGVWRELFATAGTPGSLRLVKDIAVGPASYPKHLTVSGNRIFFQASFGLEDSEPWISDGTTAGTVRLADLMLGNGSSTPTGFVAQPSGKVLFAAAGTAGVELMVTDGTSAGTVMVSDIEPGVGTNSSFPKGLAAISGQELYFSAYTPDVGFEPRRWTPTGGVQLIAEIEPGASTPYQPDSQFTEAWLGDHRLVFFEDQAPSTSFNLWATDGTTLGTHPVKNLNPGLTFGYISRFLPALNRVFLTMTATGVSSGLWVSDGTEQGTIELLNSNPASGASDLVELGDSVLFAFTGAAGDRELWTTDGTPAGTQKLVNLFAAGSSDPRLMTRVQDKVVFTARNQISSSHRDVFITDGTPAGTKSVFPIGTSPSVVESGGFVEMGGDAYFLGTPSGGSTTEIWKIDPVLEAATFVAPASNSPFPANDPQLTATNDKLFYRMPYSDAQGYNLGRELVVSDGTAAGTQLVIDLAPGPDSSYPTELVPANGGVYFTLEQAKLGFQTDPAVEIYFSDGTAAGTYQVCASPAGVTPEKPTMPLSSLPMELTLAGGNLFWIGTAPNGVGRELFRIPQPGGHTIVLEPSGSKQRINSNDPVLGTTLTVTGTLASPADLSVLVMSAPVAAPHTTLVAYGSAAWVDPASLSVLTTTAAADWTYNTTLPATPALAGAQFTLQSWTLKGPALFPAETSNGLTIVLGN